MSNYAGSLTHSQTYEAGELSRIPNAGAERLLTLEDEILHGGP